MSTSSTSTTPADPGDLLGVAAEHVAEHVPVAHPAQPVREVRDGMVGQRYECADDVAVVVEGALVGMVPIEALLSAGADTPIGEVMDPDPAVVTPDTHQERVAWHMIERGEASIAVVDADGRFTGLIPPHRMLAVVLREHDEDLARLGGYLARSQLARQAAEEGVGRRLWHRLPWLLIGLAGAMLSAVIVGGFERQLDEKVLLAFFLPGVVYMADAVGTQTETVLIRGLATEMRLRTFLRRELLSGGVIGVLIGGSFFVFALIAWGDSAVATAVALALVASCSIATVVAMALPSLFQRLGTDPAFGSGPLATVIQDLLSILIYLLIAVAVVD